MPKLRLPKDVVLSLRRLLASHNHISHRRRRARANLPRALALTVDVSRQKSKSELTGAAVARQLLKLALIEDVLVVVGSGPRNEYDPHRKVIALSLAMYHRSTVEAMAIAAHETGHAIQDFSEYPPFVIRVSFFPWARRAAMILPFVLLLALVTGHWPLVTAGGILYVLLMAFHLLTLPIEFNASNRAHVCLLNSGMVECGSEESVAIQKMLRICAWSYVVGFVLAPLFVFGRFFKPAPRP